MTIGAPNTAVTELIDSSVGEKSVRANKSQSKQKTAPPKKHAGITTSGRVVLYRLLIKCGTAIPTKLIGPANAVTQAASKLESKIKATRNALMLTPILRA